MGKFDIKKRRINVNTNKVFEKKVHSLEELRACEEIEEESRKHDNLWPNEDDNEMYGYVATVKGQLV